jgi:hypothetical protein
MRDALTRVWAKIYREPRKSINAFLAPQGLFWVLASNQSCPYGLALGLAFPAPWRYLDREAGQDHREPSSGTDTTGRLNGRSCKSQPMACCRVNVGHLCVACVMQVSLMSRWILSAVLLDDVRHRESPMIS